MKVFFTGLCAFVGWRGNGPTTDPVRVILPKSGPAENAESPHQPMIAMASHHIKLAERTGPGGIERPTFADFAYVGPGGVEFLAWHLGSDLTLPPNPPGPLVLEGTHLVVDLARLCFEGEGDLALDPTDDHVALGLTLTSGALTAEITCSDNPDWVFTGRDADGERRTIGIDEKDPPTSMKIADRVGYTISSESADNGIHIVEFDATNPDRRIRLQVRHSAEIWVTNLSRLSQPSRERGTAAAPDRLEDVLIHYHLFATPPAVDRRFVPILTMNADPDEDSTCCVKECVRI